MSAPESRVEPGADLLCISPHSDDAEIGLGATLKALGDRGRRVWVCDLTRGELGSNASPEQRWTEAIAASEVLGLTGRLQLELPDGFIDAGSESQVGAVTAIIRWLRPRWVVSAPQPLRHPDHVATPSLVGKAAFMAILATFRPRLPVLRAWPAPPDGEPAERWQCEAVFEVCPEGGSPSLIFDVGDTWGAKQAALAAFRSQFVREAGRLPTHINEAGWLAEIDRRGRHWGFQAGCEYGEALRGAAVPILKDLPGDRWK